MTTPPHPLHAIVDAMGNMTQTFRTWTQDMNRVVPLIGTGSPEGVVNARQGQTYMDDAGVAGAILYTKRDADIGGDTTQGWILV
ncbi:MAG: hypothetical protein KAI73_06710 [Rhodospirillaceae bacterium]|nr:hypothetical protein [Rhodospirillaceae bacterium]